MCEIEMAIRRCDTEDDAVVRFVASPFIQGHKVVGRPSADIPAPVFKNHVQVLAAFGTTTVLSDISCILGVVVKLHVLTTGTQCSRLGLILRLPHEVEGPLTQHRPSFRPSHLSYNTPFSV
jgi:hypothetical protein